MPISRVLLRRRVARAHSLLRVGERHVLEELSLVARLPQRVEATVHDLVGGTFGGGMRLRSVERTDERRGFGLFVFFRDAAHTGWPGMGASFFLVGGHRGRANSRRDRARSSEPAGFATARETRGWSRRRGARGPAARGVANARARARTRGGESPKKGEPRRAARLDRRPATGGRARAARRGGERARRRGAGGTTAHLLAHESTRDDDAHVHAGALRVGRRGRGVRVRRWRGGGWSLARSEGRRRAPRPSRRARARRHAPTWPSCRTPRTPSRPRC